MVQAVAGLFDPAAKKQYTQTQVWMGGPRLRVAREIANEGHAVNLNAYATPVADFAVDTGNGGRIYAVWLNGGTVSSFPIYGGAFAIRGATGENWFTYGYRQGLALYEIHRLSGADTVIPAVLDGNPNPLSLWRNLTSYLTKGRKGFQLSGSGYEWSLSLEGAQWNSLFVFQGASVMLLQRYANSTFGIENWTDWDTTFIGYAQPIRARRSHDKNSFSFTSYGQSQYLKAVTIEAQQIGAERIHGNYSSSPILKNVDLAPEEGRIPRDFGLQNLDDDDKITTTVLADLPTQNPPLARPTGVPSAVPPMQKWHYQKIQQVFCSALDGARITSQAQSWFEMVNGMSLEPPNLPPWADDAGTPDLEPDNVNYRPPKPSDLKEHEWLTLKGGGYNLADFTIECYPSGIRLYPGRDLPETVLSPQQPVIFCFDRKNFEESHRVPEGTQIIELKNADGWAPGMWMNDARHGVGSSFSLNRLGGGLIVYTGSGPIVKDDGNSRANALIVADDIDTNGTITLDDLAGFSVRGEARAEGNINSTFQWTGLDVAGSKLTGCFRKPDATQRIPAGVRINQSWFSTSVVDAVFWGNVTPPAAFYHAVRGQLGDETLNGFGGAGAPDGERNQNVSSGFTQDTVWVNRPDPTSIFPVGAPGATVAPAGIPINTSIRRKRWAGGTLTRRADDNETYTEFAGWDSGTADDWELRAPPLPGNPAQFSQTAYFQCDLGFHPSAFVLEDLVDTLIDPAVPGYYQGKIVVGNGTAWEYPASLGDREFCAAGGVRFRYESRDSNTFYGVRKLDETGRLADPGSGDVIAVGSEILQYVDLNPDWRLGEGAALHPRNLYDVAGILWNHYKIQPAAVVVADTHNSNGQIRCGQGQLSRWPASGPFKARNQGGDVEFTYAYTSRDSTVLYGVTLTSISPEGMVRVDGEIAAEYVLPAGRAVLGGTAPNYLKTFSIYGSRRDDPVAFNAHYGQNPDWETIVSSAHMDHGPALLTDVLSTGHAPRWRHLAVHVWETNDGKYPALSSLHFYRIPKRTGDEFRDARALVTGGHSYGDVVNEILNQAGVYATDRRIAMGGPFVRTIPVAKDNAWAIIVDIAEKAGYVAGESNLGKIEWTPDPRRPGAPFPQKPAIVLDKTNVFGEATIEELPYHAASQVHLTAINTWDQEVYDVTVPPQPYELGGGVREVKSRFATSLQDAVFQAQNELARANGGYRIRMPIGHMDTFRPLDLARVHYPFDVTGYKEDRSYMIVGGEWEFSRDGQTGVLELQTFKKA